MTHDLLMNTLKYTAFTDSQIHLFKEIPLKEGEQNYSL